MKWPWSKSKVDENAPAFWKRYLKAFDVIPDIRKQPLETMRFVAFDTETTGLNPREDRILAIGGVGIRENRIIVSDSLELYLEQEHYNPESAPIHGILKHGAYHKVNEMEAIEKCLDFIGTDVLVGHHVGFDRDVINAALARYGLGTLKNKFVDTGVMYKRLVHPINRPLQEKYYTLEALSEALKIPLHDRHTASGDAMITALAFIKMKDRLPSKKELTLKKLYPF